jgi:RNA polymerase sigma factor (sigma-70 family)
VTPRFPGLPFSKDTAACIPIASEPAAAMANVSDEALLASICSGEKDALGLLFQRYAHVVQSIGRRILRDATEAEDLVQDLFLFIQRKCSIFDSSKSSAGSWIVQMAYQRSIERRRYLTTRHFYTRAEIQGNASCVVSTPTVENDYSAEAVFGRNGLQKVLTALSEDQRETLRLHFFEGYTLSAVYHRRYDAIVSLFGLSMSDLKRYQASLGVPNTHLLTSDSEPDIEKVSLPVRFKEEFQ